MDRTSPVSGQSLTVVYRKSAERNDDGAFHYTRSTGRHGSRHQRPDRRQRGHGRDRAGWDAAAVHASARASRDRATQVGHRRLSLDEPACQDTNASARRSARLRHLRFAGRGHRGGTRVRPGMLVVAEPEPRSDSSSIRAMRARSSVVPLEDDADSVEIPIFRQTIDLSREVELVAEMIVLGHLGAERP